jgi:MFS family permease
VERPAALSQPDFRSLWLAGMISDAGDWMLLVALPIVVYALTGSALGTAAAFVAELAPGMLLAPVAGLLADRVDRRRLLLAVTSLQALSLLPLLFVDGRAGLALVYGVIVVQALLATLFEPTKNALLPTLVEPQQYVSANSLVALGGGIGRLVGGPLGGLLLAAGQLHAIVVADALSFAVAGWLIAGLPGGSRRSWRRAPSRIGGYQSALRALSAIGGNLSPRRASPAIGGYVSALRAPRIRSGLVIALIAGAAQGIFVVLFILFVARRLHGGAGEIGLLRGVQAVGAICAGLVLGLARHSMPAGSLAAAGAFAFGALDLVVWNAPALVTGVALYLLLFAAVGAPGVVMVTGLISSLQLSGTDAERGRVFGALTLATNAGQAAGMLAAGLLTAPLGLMTLLDAQGCLYLLAGAVAAATLAGPVRRRRGHGESLVPARSASLGR